MPEILRLSEVLSKKAVYGDFTERYVTYVPERKKVELTKYDTGWYTSQSIWTETLRWNPILLPDSKLALVGSQTNFILKLLGEEGYKYGVDALKKACSVYDSEKLGLHAIPLTEEIFEKLPEKLKMNHTFYWLATKFSGSFGKGIKVVLGFGVVKEVTLYNMRSYESRDQFSICPVIPLPDDTMIYIRNPYIDGLTPNKPIQLILNPEKVDLHLMFTREDIEQLKGDVKYISQIIDKFENG